MKNKTVGILLAVMLLTVCGCASQQTVGASNTNDTGKLSMYVFPQGKEENGYSIEYER